MFFGKIYFIKSIKGHKKIAILDKAKADLETKIRLFKSLWIQQVMKEISSSRFRSEIRGFVWV